MNFFYRIIVLFIFFFYSCSSNDKSISNLESVSYIKTDVKSLKVIKGKSFKSFKTPRISYKNGNYWFKVVLTERAKDLKRKVFFIEEPSIAQIWIYNNDELLTTKKAKAGKANIFLEIENTDYKEFFIRVCFRHQAHFPLEVIEEAPFHRHQEKKFLLGGLYYGIAIMVAVLNLIFYFLLKDKTFLFYAIFLGSINVSFSSLDGYAYIFFSPNKLEFFFTLFHFLIELFGLLFASNFLQLHRFSPKLNLIGRLTLIFPLVSYSMFLYTEYFFYRAIGDLLGLIILSFYWVSGIMIVRKEVYARFFVIGYSMILIMGIFYLVPLNFGIDSFSASFTLLKFAALFEMMVLTFAITYRVKKLQKENDFFNNEIKKHINELYELKKELKNHKDNKANVSLTDKISALRGVYDLTDREVDVVLQIVKGHSNKKIAEDLFISVSTVKYHTRNLYEKLNVKKRTEVSAKLLS